MSKTAEQTARRSRRVSLRDPALLTYAGLLAIAFVVLMYLNRDQWFYYEDWALVGYWRESDSWSDWLLATYNGHLIALPTLEFWLLRELVGLHTYWPYATVLVLAHLTAVVLLWRIAVQAGAEPLVATATAMPFAVLSVGSENLLWAYQVAFVAPVAFGLGAIAIASAPERSLRRDAASVALVLMALLCSGVGVVMVVALSLLGWLQGGPRRAARLGIVPAVLYVAWLVSYPFENPWALTRWGEVPDVFEYVVRGLSMAFGRSLFDLPYIGGIVVVLVVAYAVARVRDVRGAVAPAYALAGSSVALLFTAGYSRIKVGLEQGIPSRYLYIVVALAVPLCAVVLTRATRGRLVGQSAILLGAVAVTAYNLNGLSAEAGRQAASETTVRDVVLAAAYLTIGRPEESIQDATAEPLHRTLTVRDLRRMARNGLLPELPTPDPIQALGLAPHVLVGLEPRRDEPDVGCTVVRPGETKDVETGDARTAIPIRSDGPVEIRISLHDPALRATSPFRELHWEGGAGTIVVLRRRAVAELTPTDRPVRICQPERGTS